MTCYLWTYFRTKTFRICLESTKWEEFRMCADLLNFLQSAPKFQFAIIVGIPLYSQLTSIGRIKLFQLPAPQISLALLKRYRWHSAISWFCALDKTDFSENVNVDSNNFEVSLPCSACNVSKQRNQGVWKVHVPFTDCKEMW